jgi:hypothetical protein
MSASLSRKWIELNWLRKGNKEIPLPELLFEHTGLCGAYYMQPSREEVLIGNRFYDLSKGFIVVNPSNDDSFIANSIAHEWRHHWQYCHGLSNPNPPQYKDCNNYEKSIANFFRGCWSEMDALLFSIEKIPDDISLYWMEILRKEKICVPAI